jgi:hypothetical protein
VTVQESLQFATQGNLLCIRKVDTGAAEEGNPKKNGKHSTHYTKQKLKHTVTPRKKEEDKQSRKHLKSSQRRRTRRFLGVFGTYYAFPQLCFEALEELYRSRLCSRKVFTE